MTRKIKFTITKVRKQTIEWTKANVIFCPVCGSEAESLTAAESIRFLEIENQTLDCLIHSGVIHAIETASGNLRVCKNSLLR